MDQCFRGSLLNDFDRNFRAVGFGKPGLVFEAGGDGTVAALMGVAVFVEVEQLWRHLFSEGVTLAFVLVDVDSQLSRHGGVSLGQQRTSRCMRFVLAARAHVKFRLAMRQSYIILHSYNLALSRQKLKWTVQQ